MTEEKKKIHLPAWAKITLAVFAVACTALFVFLVSGAAWLVQLKKTAVDPAKMPVVTNSILKIDNPLPKGYAYDAAVPIFGFVCTMLHHDPDNTMFYLIRLPNPDSLEAKVLSKQWAKHPPTGSSALTVSKEGEQTVAGEQLCYVQGPATDPTGDKAQEYVAVIVPKGKKEAVLIVGKTPGTTYNEQATQELLAAIKGF